MHINESADSWHNRCHIQENKVPNRRSKGGNKKKSTNRLELLSVLGSRSVLPTEVSIKLVVLWYFLNSSIIHFLYLLFLNNVFFIK